MQQEFGKKSYISAVRQTGFVAPEVIVAAF